jgi:molybdate transport system substrate-binding protein
MDCKPVKRGKAATLLSTIPLCNLSLILSTSIAALTLGIAVATAAGPELLIAAAADLSGVQEPLARGFERATGQKARFTLGASGMLTRQIEQGAPYDVFLSANEAFVADLVKSGRLAPDSVRVYAYGRLGLWSKDGAVKTLADLRNPRVLHLAMANPAHAPYGVAAREMFERLGLWKELEPKVVYGENVRQALEYAESGNADAVITAWSLLFDRGGVLLPDSNHAQIRQAGGVVAGRPHAAAARRFLDYLASPEGRRILTTHGFSVPGE